MMFIHGGHRDRVNEIDWNLNEKFFIVSVGDDNLCMAWQVVLYLIIINNTNINNIYINK